jgi:hypothetical protein
VEFSLQGVEERCIVPVAENVVVASNCYTEEDDAECEERYQYEGKSAESADLDITVSCRRVAEGPCGIVVHSYEDTYL